MTRAMWAVLVAGGVAAAIGCGGSSAGSGRSSPMRELRFSGYEWRVKSSSGRVGPGPNYFSDSAENVFVDDQGRLHLRITRRNGQWRCAEVISKRSFGYGTYRFYLDTAAGALDPQVVLGLFTWSDAPAYAHREIDVEISRWAQAANQNAQFVVQPYKVPGNLVRFQVPPDLARSTHVFTWVQDRVACQSVRGHPAFPAPPADVIREHTFTQGIPRPGDENARVNLWLVDGKPPQDGNEVEVVLTRFDFVPAKAR